MFKLKNQRISMRKKVSLVGLTLIFTSLFVPSFVSPVRAAGTLDSRLAGADRYQTAIKISQGGWESANTVVLARGDDFPDALAGAVLANSAKAKGPLLLTDSNTLQPEVLTEIQRLNAQKVYILGGTGAVSDTVKKALEDNGRTVQRLEGADRYETAAAIAREAVSNSPQVFLAYGESFADALSISSYAAAQGMPLLLTDNKKVPQVTLDALHSLGVKAITLIGGTGVIGSEVKTQLEGLGYTVDRRAGDDRYLTNLDVLNNLNFNTSNVFVATGLDFPDALAGAVLAAKNNNPIILVPQSDLAAQTTSYLYSRRASASSFTLLGGWGVISYGVESIIRTGSAHPRISLQYWDGYANLDTYRKQLALIPGMATDYVDLLSPNWRKEIKEDGTLALQWGWDSSNYLTLAQEAQARGLKVLPLINGSGSVIDTMLANPAARANLISQIVKLVELSKTDGVVVDFELLSDADGPYLTEFMKALAAELKPKNKLVVMAVMPITSPEVETWLVEYNYQDLAQYADYLHLMTYDHHYRTSAPGAIAPVEWVKKVLAYAKSAGVPADKILMGMPYWGRDWAPTSDGKWNSTAFGLSKAKELAAQNNAEIKRETSAADPVGVPYFTYTVTGTDNSQVPHTVYFDDEQSWSSKLSLLDQYGIGGIGPWAMGWLDSDSAGGLFPLLKSHLR